MPLFSRLTLAWRLTPGFGLVLALMVGITLTGIQIAQAVQGSSAHMRALRQRSQDMAASPA